MGAPMVIAAKKTRKVMDTRDPPGYPVSRRTVARSVSRNMRAPQIGSAA
jgi:hypothetical protein